MSLDHLPDLERDPVVEGECGVKGQRAGLKGATNCTFSHLVPQCSHLPNVNMLLFLRIIMQINLDNLFFFSKKLWKPHCDLVKNTLGRHGLCGLCQILNFSGAQILHSKKIRCRIALSYGSLRVQDVYVCSSDQQRPRRDTHIYSLRFKAHCLVTICVLIHYCHCQPITEHS